MLKRPVGMHREQTLDVAHHDRMTITNAYIENIVNSKHMSQLPLNSIAYAFPIIAVTASKPFKGTFAQLNFPHPF